MAVASEESLVKVPLLNLLNPDNPPAMVVVPLEIRGPLKVLVAFAVSAELNSVEVEVLKIVGPVKVVVAEFVTAPLKAQLAVKSKNPCASFPLAKVTGTVVADCGVDLKNELGGTKVYTPLIAVPAES